MAKKKPGRPATGRRVSMTITLDSSVDDFVNATMKHEERTRSQVIDRAIKARMVSEKFLPEETPERLK